MNALPPETGQWLNQLRLLNTLPDNWLRNPAYFVWYLHSLKMTYKITRTSQATFKRSQTHHVISSNRSFHWILAKYRYSYWQLSNCEHRRCLQDYRRLSPHRWIRFYVSGGLLGAIFMLMILGYDQLSANYNGYLYIKRQIHAISTVLSSLCLMLYLGLHDHVLHIRTLSSLCWTILSLKILCCMIHSNYWCKRTLVCCSQWDRLTYNVPDRYIYLSDYKISESSLTEQCPCNYIHMLC